MDTQDEAIKLAIIRWLGDHYDKDGAGENPGCFLEEDVNSLVVDIAAIVHLFSIGG